MLDTTTKTRINTARDILVGKVPDPKSQVEQITIALIYKFMDDMDAETEALGGKRTFFTGKYEKYGWRKMFDPKLSGFDMLNLYSEAIQQMNVIASVPQLFRDIFKNAYLPYRDPETLKAFLKIINEFEYDHSERLGDAFEFLLSVLGSQGDAGQFRTPRHIIDFVVRITDPKKQDKILDPACGTAGFLISGYKHILQQNSKDGMAGRALTNDDRKRLVQNFRGYDISPDMVRLSLVNMYLHGFTTPHIEEYDTLTSEDKWNEYYDVVLANPPFMSPKGGIRPHKRFSVQSNRSEVLFVDYIAEHLTPNGRAAIIVPEGIIFQSGTAYKQLRKMLVEQYLYAVVSLPAGVFNPYSGVKTSILLLDKTIAKRTSKILFVKIQNDGFDLGAQRRPIDKSDLYFAEELLKYYKQHIGLDDFDVQAAIAAATVQNKKDHAVNDEIPLVKIEASQWLYIDKEKIAENGDWNLSGDRYRESTILKQSKFDLVKIGAICNLINGRAFKPEDWERKEEGGLPIIRIQNLNNQEAEFNYYSKEVLEKVIVNTGDLLFSWSGSKGTSFGAHIWHGSKAILNQHIFRVEHSDIASRKYLLHALNKAVEEVEENLHGGVGLVHITKGNLEKIKIPLPPLSVQEQIVAEIESYQKVIDGAKQVVENYKPNIYIQPEWEVLELGEVITFVSSGATPLGGKDNYSNKGILFIRSQNILFGSCDFSDAVYISNETHEKMTRSQVKFNDVFLNITGASIGRCALMEEKIPANVNQHVAIIRVNKNKITPKALMHFMNSENLQRQIWSNQSGASRQALNYEQIKQLQIPLPPLAEQEAIVQQLETERQLVENNKQLITLMQQKIQATIARVWGGGKKEAKVYEQGEEALSMVAEG